MKERNIFVKREIDRREREGEKERKKERKKEREHFESFPTNDNIISLDNPLQERLFLDRHHPSTHMNDTSSL